MRPPGPLVRAQLLWHATAPLLLLTALATAASTSRSGLSAPHTVFAAECNDYMDWQSIAVVYSHRKAKVAGPITRLLTCSDDNLASYANLDLVPTHLAPSWSFNPHNNDSYLAYNKPAAIVHWLQEAPPKEDWVLVIDPDMIVRDTFADWGRVYGAERGWAVSVYFGYMQGVDNNLSATHIPEISPRQDALAGPRGRRGDQVSGVVLMHRNDLASMAPMWLHYSEVVRDDPMAYNETGDEWAQQPGRKPWIAEMYGYSFGAAVAGVWHRVDLMAQLYPGYMAYDKPLIMHYGRLFEIGQQFAYQKHWFLNFKALQCPPWPHMRTPLTGKEASSGVTGGMYPHPPHPREFETLPLPERYKELLSISVITTLNAAFCEKHFANCPPSEELARECAKAKQLERDVDATIQEIEWGGPLGSERICKDMKAECQGWMKEDLCWQDPRFMHFYCRSSCGLCRLPAGRPKLAFGGDKPQQEQEQGQQHRARNSAASTVTDWHDLHARGRLRLGGGRDDDEAAGSDLRRGMLYGGLGTWAIMLAAVFGALIRNTWTHHPRRGSHSTSGSAAEQRTRHALDRLLNGGSGEGGSGRASPSLPLLRAQAAGRGNLRSLRSSMDEAGLPSIPVPGASGSTMM